MRKYRYCNFRNIYGHRFKNEFSEGLILCTYKNQIVTRPETFTHKYICIHAHQHPCNPPSETPGYGPEYIGLGCVATYGSKADILPAARHPSQAPVAGFVPVAVVEPKVVFAHRQLK